MICFISYCLNSKHTKCLDEFLSVKLMELYILLVLNNVKNIFIYLNLWYTQEKTQECKRYIVSQVFFFIFS